MNLKNDHDEYILITGESRGIGKEIAEEFARRQNNLVLVARNKDALESLAEKFKQTYKIKVFIISIDLSKEESPKIIYDWCIENKIQINCLINEDNKFINKELAFVKFRHEESFILMRISISFNISTTYSCVFLS